MSLDRLDIRRRYSARFKNEIQPRSLLNCLSVLGLHMGFAGAVIALSIAVWQINLLLGALFFPIAGILVATRYRALANILHECTHNCFAGNFAANNVFARLICILLFYSLRGYKEHHSTHHAFTGDYQRDLEFGPIKNYELHKDLNRDSLTRIVGRLIRLQHLGHYIGGVALNLKEPVVWIGARVAYLAILAGVVIYWGFFSIPTFIVTGYVLLPVFVFVPTITYIMDVMDHGGLLGNSNVAERARNYTTDSVILNFLFFPHYDAYHLVHHLFPNLPTRLLPHCHRVLLDSEPEYAALPHSLEQLRATIKGPGQRAQADT